MKRNIDKINRIKISTSILIKEMKKNLKGHLSLPWKDKDKDKKIKWKIVSASVGIIVLLTLSIVFFTHEEVNSLVFSESSEELQNYSNMGFQLFERTYEGSWSIKEGK